MESFAGKRAVVTGGGSGMGRESVIPSVTESYEVRWIPAWARVLDVPTSRHRGLKEAMAIRSNSSRPRPRFRLAQPLGPDAAPRLRGLHP
jgi:hypothetical protein